MMESRFVIHIRTVTLVDSDKLAKFFAFHSTIRGLCLTSLRLLRYPLKVR